MTEQGDSRVKVHILGGGVGAMTAAFELTSPDNPNHGRYDVTVYQMGWRLGGKGASGRNARFGQRIEEHGLHIWLGFYNNAINGMRACYEELGRRKGAEPLATWDEAFHPQGFITFMEWHDAQWKRWDISFPSDPDVQPGGLSYPSTWEHVRMLLGWMVELLGQEHGPGRDSWAEALLEATHGVDTLGAFCRTELHEACEKVESLLGIAPSRHPVEAHDAIKDALRSFVQKLQKEVEQTLESDDDKVRRMAALFDLSCAAILGLFEEGVLSGRRTFAELDGMELREFLRKHGAHESALSSPALRGYYDIAFAFKDGKTDPAHWNSGAGSALLALLRMGFAYKGAFMWEMQAGMGDTIFAPYYEVLRRRGVTFKFFHKVTKLELADDEPRVARIRMARQVDVIGGADNYDPLVPVDYRHEDGSPWGKLPCWPSEPRYDQLVQGEALKKGPPPHDRPYNLESDWCEWRNVDEDVVVEVGEDDRVVLGIALGALGPICKDLAEREPRWKDMLERVETVQTQSLQLWLTRDTWELGWKQEIVPPATTVDRTVLDGYADPFNSWADMHHLLKAEDWSGEDLDPKGLAYLCGPMETGALPPPTDTGFPQREREKTRDVALRWLAENTGSLWPDATRAGSPAFDWNLVVDGQNQQGDARIHSQFWRCNLDGTERYVQTIAGSTRYRLPAGGSLFSNLVLAGDWTDTGFNVGCVECATMSGMQAARAVSGYPKVVVGEGGGRVNLNVS